MKPRNESQNERNDINESSLQKAQNSFSVPSASHFNVEDDFQLIPTDDAFAESDMRQFVCCF